ncbi:MAG: LuxR family transcriptional regulator, partial [Gordonibacter sp.]
MAEQSTMPQEGWIERHPLLVSTLGYGIVCGLTFPLMISSTFLKEMSLSHGAGNSFGTLFFLAYAITMIATAATHLFRRKRIHRRRMVSAFGAVFLGNVVMLVRYLGHLSGEWPYAVLAAGLIGYGLATAELGWMARIATLRDEGRLALERAVP